MDGNGGTASITIANVMQSNGVIHVIDRVLMPRPESAGGLPLAD